MFKISALPASYGDCLWIEYGAEDKPHIILIDAGPSVPAALKSRLEELAKRKGEIELVVVTHVDRDHIGGALTLVENEFYGVPVRDFWFNGFRHLPVSNAIETFGEKQGERLTELLLEKKISWNVTLNNSGIMVTPQACPEFQLPGGAKITLLSPDVEQLKKLRTQWVKVCGEADLYTGIVSQTTHFDKEGLESFGVDTLNISALVSEPFTEDTSAANGSSIAFVMEFEGKRVLLAADAYPSRIMQSLALIAGSPPYQFDLVKVPHHGSENNINNEFIESLNCNKYLISSNGAVYKHPSKQAISRIIHYGKDIEISFNYRSDYSAIWDDIYLKSIHFYSTNYGDDDGVTISL